MPALGCGSPEDASSLLPRSEPLAQKVLGRSCSWWSKERGTRGLRVCKSREFSRGREWKVDQTMLEGCELPRGTDADACGFRRETARAGAGERRSKGTLRGCGVALTDTPVWGLSQQTVTVLRPRGGRPRYRRGQGWCVLRPLSWVCGRRSLPGSSRGCPLTRVCVLISSSQKSPVSPDCGPSWGSHLTLVTSANTVSSDSGA